MMPFEWHVSSAMSSLRAGGVATRSPAAKVVARGAVPDPGPGADPSARGTRRADWSM